MPRMGKTEEDWNGLKLGFLIFLRLIPADCKYKNNVRETYLFVSDLWFCHLHLCNFFAYFKFYSDWGRVIRKIKQNGLDSRDTAPLIIKDSWVKQKMNWSPTSAAPKTAGRFWQPKKLPTEWAFISDSLIKVMNITRPAKSRNSRSSLRR